MKSLKDIHTKADFIHHLQALQNSFTPTYRKLADYLVQNFTETSFMTAQQWSHQVQTSEVSVIRFVRSLGFKGYPDFSETLQKVIRQEMTMTDYIQVSIKKTSAKTKTSILWEIIQDEKRNLNELIQKFDQDIMDNMISKIHDAEEIIVVGTRSSAPLAEYCSYMLIRSLGKEILTLSDCGYQTFDALIPWLKKKPLVFAFAYPRYPEKTMQIVEFLKEHDATIIGITNNELSPLVPLSDDILYAPSHSLAFTDSYGSATVLINTIIMELIDRYPKYTDQIIPQFEKIAKERKYYRFK